MIKQRLSNLFKLRMYDIESVMEYCIENNITIVVNDYKQKPLDEYKVVDLDSVWKELLTCKPYNKYSK